MKTCTVCKNEKELTEFHKNKATKDGLHYVCKICHRTNVLKWQKEKPAAHKKAMAKYNKLHPERNDVWQENNKEWIREYDRQWSKKHPEKVQANCAKRRAKKLQACPVWADPKAILAVYKEANRLTKETGVKHHVDHFYPLRGKTVSGLHVEFNLRAIPATENLSKGNRLV